MRKAILLPVILILLLQLVSATIEFEHECYDKDCIQDTEILYKVSIQNNLEKDILVDAVNIKEIDSGKVIALYVGAPVSLATMQVHTFNISSLVHEPAEGYTIYYTSCFEATVLYEDNDKISVNLCSEGVKSFTTIPLKNIKCRTDDECSKDEHCNTFSLYECKPVQCVENQIIISHKCVTCKYPSLSGMGYCISPVYPVIIILLIIYVVMRTLKKEKKGKKGKKEKKDEKESKPSESAKQSEPSEEKP